MGRLLQSKLDFNPPIAIEFVLREGGERASKLLIVSNLPKKISYFLHLLHRKFQKPRSINRSLNEHCTLFSAAHERTFKRFNRSIQDVCAVFIVFKSGKANQHDREHTLNLRNCGTTFPVLVTSVMILPRFRPLMPGELNQSHSPKKSASLICPIKNAPANVYQPQQLIIRWHYSFI
jgi:hypothetical protein